MDSPEKQIQAARGLSEACAGLRFSPPVAFVYNPLEYAWEPHAEYLRKWGRGRKQCLLLGMNPGPWGMAQVGVPFGEIGYVRDWLSITGTVGHPEPEHPKRVIEGFDCVRSEVSGRRLWGLFAERFGTADAFFVDHFVTNYCPLVFLEDSGRNRTPNKLPAAERDVLFALCDSHLRQVVEALEPLWVVGVGKFAAGQAEKALADMDVRVADVLHPSPASPRANRGWAAQAEQRFKELGIWQ